MVNADVTDPEVVNIAADNLVGTRGQVLSMHGNVLVSRGEMTLAADQVTYNEATEVIEAINNVQVWEPRMFLEGRRAQLDTVNETSDISAASFKLAGSHARGSADRIRIDGRDMMRLDRASYTTCEVGDEAWVLDAGSVELDGEEREGVARDVWVTFYGVPLFYTPYLSFPIGDERKTGCCHLA